MEQKFNIMKVADITARDQTKPDSYWVFEIISGDGEELLHRRVERDFQTKEDADAWVSKNSESGFS